MESLPPLFEPCLEKQLKGHRNAVTALCYNPNEQQLASSSLDNSVLLWDLGDSMRSYRFQGHSEAVTDVSFSSSGKYMATSSRDKTVRLWVPTVTGSTGVIKAHSQTVRSVQFSPDASKILTASDDKIVKMWISEKLKFLVSLVGHTNWVRCARMSNDGSIIASCSDDKTTRLWNPDSGECIHIYKDQKGCGQHLAWHPSGCYIAVGTSHGSIKLYDIRTHNIVQYYSIHCEAVTKLSFHPSGSYIITSSKDGKMKVLDLLEGHPIFTLTGHSGAVSAVTFSPCGGAFASGGDDKLVFIWKTNFTELANDANGNVPISSKVSSASRPRGNQVTSVWYKCYHSTKYPVTTFAHLHDAPQLSQNESRNLPGSQAKPNANSTFINPEQNTDTYSSPRQTSVTFNDATQTSCTVHSDCQFGDCSYSVGHISHIPRTPPSPATYTVPSIVNKSIGTSDDHEDLFGLIKLKESDVCYTSGAIEWVGRKRSFPLNTGFKIFNEKQRISNEPLVKKVKRLDKTFTLNLDKINECDCGDVLPTVNAIVDHLNALHEAVDLVDLRLNTLEDTISKDK